MRRPTRTFPLFAALVAALFIAAPGYAALTAPTGTTTTIGVPVPAFSWTAVAGADHYQFELSAGSTFGTPLVTISTKNTRATVTQTISDGPYTWHVRAVTATSVNGPWSAPVTWTKTGSGPTLIAPAANATVTYPNPLLLQWSAVDGAYDYVVSIADASSMANPTTATTEGTSYSPGNWLPPGVHYWSVTARDSRGNPVGTTPVSGGSAFTWVWPSTVANPQVASSVDASAGATAQWTMYDPVFTWNPVDGAVKYQVEVNSDDVTWAGGSKVCCSTDIVGTKLTPKALLPNATYAWRVRAVDASGYAGPWTVGPTFTQSYDSFVTAPTTSTPSVPNLRMADNLGDPGTDVDPAAGYQTQVPVVKWDPVPGASGYDVTMVRYVGGACEWTTSNVPRWSARTAATSFTPTASGWNNLLPWGSFSGVTTDTYDLIANTSYCVRVTPFRDTAVTGGFSYTDVSGDPSYLDPNNDGTAPAFTFTGFPTGGACSAPCTSGYLGDGDYQGPLSGSSPAAVPLFTWKPVAGANGYFVIVARDQAFGTIVDYAFTHIPAYAPRSGGYPRTYQNQSTKYWWVVLPSSGADGSGAATTPNTGHSQWFNRPQVGPTQVSPAANAGVPGQPTFVWNPIDGARNYELEISADPNFQAASLEDITTSNISYTSLDKSYPADSDLYWRVRAKDYNDKAQPWSTVRKFHQSWPAPTFTGITNPTAGDTVPTFGWNSVTGAIAYDVHVNQPNNGTSDFTVQSTAFAPSAVWGLGDFTWTVRAVFSNGYIPTKGPWSATQTYTRSIHAPTGLVTLAPTGTAQSPVLLSWNWKPGVKTYNVQVSRDPSFGSTVESTGTDTSSWAPSFGVSDYGNGGQMYWRVQGVDSHSTSGTWSAAMPLVFAAKLVPSVSSSVIAHGSASVITVTVKDATGHAVGGAKVTVSGAGITPVAKLTASNGTVKFKVIPKKSGTIKWTATKAGCITGVATTTAY
jgi:hypothetical protein